MATKKKVVDATETASEETSLAGVNDNDTKPSADSTNGEAVVVSADEATARKLHERALDCRHRIDEATFELAEVLYVIYDKAHYVALGYKTWREYVEKELDFALRKAQYMVQMWEWYGIKLADHPEVRQKVETLGWTKSKELIGIVDQSNVDDWVEKAKTMSAVQLVEVARDALKAIENGDDGAKNKPKDAQDLKSKTFRLDAGQTENIERALVKAGEIGNTEDKAKQLDMICTDFISTNVGAKGKKAIQALLKRIEANLGISIVAIDPETSAVLYGNKTIDKIVEALGGGTEPEKVEASPEA